MRLVLLALVVNVVRLSPQLEQQLGEIAKNSPGAPPPATRYRQQPPQCPTARVVATRAPPGARTRPLETPPRDLPKTSKN